MLMSPLILDKSFLASGQPLARDIEAYPDGIIVPIDKPYRWTSADVIRKLKYAACHHFGKKNLKVGHAGTLDPLATGVLLVCIGKATRLAEDLQRHPKEYLAGVTFGATTPSYDLEKEIDTLYPYDEVSETSLRGVLPSFLGEQEQVAPLFSAKSVDGVRAYELARRQYKAAKKTSTVLPCEPLSAASVEPLSSAGSGETSALSRTMDEAAESLLSRQLINIFEMELLSFGPHGIGIEELTGFYPSGSELPVTRPDAKNTRINVTDTSALSLPCALLRVCCSKGTYIRALARDLGESLHTGAHLRSLARTHTGTFSLSAALTLEEVMKVI